MAKAGDVIDNPVTGERFVVHKSGGETNGQLIEGQMFVRSRALGPPEHIHPRLEERFRVAAGTLNVSVGGDERTLTAGEEVVIPPGTSHRFWNDSDSEASFVGEVRPAMRMEAMLETFFGLARDGKTNEKGVPNLLQMAVLAAEYFDEMYVTRPPLAVQRVLFGILAPIGKLLGYKARYPQYSGDE